MTLISITAPDVGPVAHREVEQIVPDGQVPFGGFATVMGESYNPKDNDSNNPITAPPKVLYMFGITNSGLQLARALLQDVRDYTKWTFFDPLQKKFVGTAPTPNENSTNRTYLDGSFSSGNIFYSTYSPRLPACPYICMLCRCVETMLSQLSSRSNTRNHVYTRVVPLFRMLRALFFLMICRRQEL